jgi:hypothetical protein
MIQLHASHSAITTQSHARAVAPAGVSRATESADAAELKLVQQLSSRGRGIRTHKQAHMAASGGLAQDGPSFQFSRGPDGRLYVTGGEVDVDVDVAPVANDPQATIKKAQQIWRAALAPTSPSQADRAVAARAMAMANEARLELQSEAQDAEGTLSPADSSSGSSSGDDSLGRYSNATAEQKNQIDISI